MKAARYYGPGKITVEDLQEPHLAVGEVLIAMKACGICGTDIKTYVRGHPKISPGSVLGHEVAGVVVDTKHPDFSVGDRVVAAPYAPCLSCAMCRQGHFSLCDNLFESSLDPGGFSEMIRVPKRIADQVLLKLADNLDFEMASLTEPLACCIHGLEALNLQAGQSLLVVGDGPMGLLQAALGKSLGASPVVVSGLTPGRLDFAARVADLVIDASKESLARALKEYLPDGAEKVIVSVGSIEAVQDVLPLVSKGGAINIFAGMPKDATLSLNVSRTHYDEIAILGTFGFGPPHFRKALDFLSRGELPIAGFFTKTVTMENIEEALKASSHYEGIKTLVVAHNV
jgi:L-iditol 2-dehydrogenase